MSTAKPIMKTLEPRRAPRAIRVPVLVILRIFLLASFSIIGCIWALWRYYTHPRPPMFVPAAAASAPNEIPAPDLEPVR